MDASDLLQHAVDYIEENLRSEISAEEIAKAAGFSVHHFYHLFSAATGLSVMQYVTQRRLKHAACQIAAGRKIIDAALEYGFDSASGFTRAFRREFGRPPREYAAAVHPLPPGRFVLKELNHAMLSQKLLSRALAEWNLTTPVQSVMHSSGVRSENLFQAGPYLLHARPSRSPLALSMAAEECLRKSGLPSIRTLPAQNGEPIVELEGMFFRLTERFTGSFIPACEMFADMRRPLAVGAALARLHEALKPMNAFPELNRPDLLKSTLDWSLPAAARAMNLPDRFVQDFSAAFTQLFPQLPRTVIHRNPTPDAFLFEQETLTGYAHFEMAEINIRLFDVCYAATAILSETLGRLPDETVSRWPEVLNAITEGYGSVSPLSDAERSAIPYVVCAVQMVCVAFFSSQEQYRHLAEVNIEMTRRIIEWLFPA